MKKATNSKNKGKISKLFPIMQEHLGKSMNLARIKLMALLLEALVKAHASQRPPFIVLVIGAAEHGRMAAAVIILVEIQIDLLKLINDIG